MDSYAPRPAPHVAFECLMIAMLKSAKSASLRGSGDELFAYIDALSVGLEEARHNGVEFIDPELVTLDPYKLLGPSQRPFESLLVDVLAAAKRARDAGKTDALHTYVDVLSMGMQLASMVNFDFRDVELAALDPYALFPPMPTPR